MFDDDELLDDFITESNEHLEDVENQLLSIEAAGANIDVDVVNMVFRAIHSIKGAAGFLGLVKISDLSHALENVLNLMRNRELTPTSQIVDALLKGADTLKQLLANVGSSNEADVSRHVEVLDAIAEGRSAPNEPVASEVVAPVSPVESATIEEVPEAIVAPTTPAEVVQEVVVPETEATPTEATSAPADSGTQGASNVRVSVNVLDHLMNLAGELVLSRNQLLQAVSNDSEVALEAVASGLDQITSELQEAIMQTRLQPIGNTFNRFPRVIRDLSSKLGKQCELNIEGRDVEVDKTILEAISDPLTHLIRNSIDHDIESPEERVKAGKDAIGTVELRAYHRAGKVCLDIQDDGGGIDANKLKQKAVSKGFLSSEDAEQMGEREAVRLIFHPGFSMAEQLSDVSGRGVGMDVVRTNIEKLGGTVEVDSAVGVGTTIRITLPLTLAIIPSLIVQCSDSRFAIPQVNIAELVRIRPSELEERVGRVKNAEVLRLRGSLLPLVRLNDALNLVPYGTQEDGPKEDSETKRSALNVIVVESGRFRYGIVVDGLHDSEEIVVKPLGRHLKQSICLAGATILGDGHVALIIDVAGISAQVELREDADSSLKQAEEELSDKGERQTVLLFRNNEHEQFGVPMSIVSRLERLRFEQIDTVGGQQVLQYRGGTLSLLSLEDIISVEPRPDIDRMYVIVFDVRGKEVGIIAPHLADIRDIPMNDVDSMTFNEPGVVGSLVVGEHTTRLLDLFRLVDKAHPEWCQCPVKEDFAEEHQRTILLAEDSGFFRRQVEGYLQSDGYKVIGCEDGQHAWETLMECGDEVDLVVTDIEMPRLDGYGLSERIKADPCMSRLPIIALTSLAGDEDFRRGYDAGIDEYQVKMDREKLRAAVAKFSEKGAKLRQATDQKQELLV